MKILSKLSEEIQAAGGEVEELILQLTAACFRAQRNGCVQCARNQSLLRWAAVRIESSFLDTHKACTQTFYIGPTFS